MSTPDPNRVYRVTGRLYAGVNPASLGNAGNNYGGTPLGLINRIAISPNLDHERIFALEYGRTADLILLERDFEVAFALRDWDYESLALLFPNTTTVSTRKVVIFPGGTVQTGQTMAGPMGRTILFAADRATEHPSLLLYNAVPLLDPLEPIRLSFQSEQQIRMSFLALPGAAGGAKCAAWGLLADLVGL
jgi:hypothetical protein